MLPEPIKVKDVPPDVVGTCGKAWRFNSAIALRREKEKGIELVPDATVANWIVYAPYGHPVWAFYFLTCISLAPIPGSPPAHIFLPGATHEIMLFACSPDWQAAVDEIPTLLTPGNFAGQFFEGSNQSAALRIEKAVWGICDGTLNPDIDYIHKWIQLFGDSNYINGAIQ